jgi:hypothetical protein
MSRNSNEKLIQFNKRTFELEKQLHPKHYILQRTIATTFLIKKNYDKKIYMIVTYYSHTKKIHNLKFMEFEVF